MSEYIEREALKRAIRKVFHDLGTRIEINSIINEQPTADVVEVIRCKDCINYKKCFDHYICCVFDWVSEPNDYCSYFAERREDDEE